MYRLALFIIMLLTSQVEAQTETKYQTGMQKAFALWEENKTEEAVNLFERIASAETDNWLPSYYAAQILILDGFTKLQDTKTLDAQLKRAQDFINDATTNSKNNPEILVMQALLHTVYVASDGAKYGMTLAPKVAQFYEQAYKIDPTNPRVVLNKAEWNIGSARYFGQDTKPFCKEFNKALELFANFKPKSQFYPNWGKERAEEMIKSCNK
ncbi:tetratricopeptide repeat protein [Lacinutrix chionoecetis]